MSTATMSQPRIVITEPIMRCASSPVSIYTSSDAASPVQLSTAHHSQHYASLRPDQYSTIMSESTCTNMETNLQARKLSKRWSKQSSTSAASNPSKKEKRQSKSKPTLTIWPSRSTGTRSPTTTTTSSVSTPTTIYTPGTSINSSPSRRHSNLYPSVLPSPTKVSPIRINTSSSPSAAAPASTARQNPPYDPLQNHVPCLHPNCVQTFCPSLLGPTFYSPQKPYGFKRLPGLCPDHAYADLRVANAEAKKEGDLRRQNAGRKAMNLIAGEFDIFLKSYEEAREEEGKRLERRMRVRVLGEVAIPGNLSTGDEKTFKEKTRKQAEEAWDWRYAARPCTKKGCQSNWYSIFDIHLFDFYRSEKRFRLRPLSSLCPTCARKDLDDLLRRIDAKYESLDVEVWHAWVAQIRQNRDVERAFWEKAQERVVRERGIRFRVVEEKRKEEVIELEGKGVETVREMCVVM